MPNSKHATAAARVRPRASQRKVQTRRILAERALIEAAEELYARHGLDGVSLREIGAYAGSANNSVVQHHFGGKDNLIRAIFEFNLVELDAVRAQRLAAAEAAGLLGDLKTLVETLLLPIAQHENSQGRTTYLGFLLAVQQGQSISKLRDDSDHIAPVTRRLITMIRDLRSELPDGVFKIRLAGASLLFFSQMARIATDEAPEMPRNAVMDDAIDQAVAVLAAAYRPRAHLRST